jgi:hypothetical protein
MMNRSTGLCQNKHASRVLSSSSPQDGPKTKPGDLEAISLSHVPGTSLWGSEGVLGAVHLRAKK